MSAPQSEQLFQSLQSQSFSIIQPQRQEHIQQPSSKIPLFSFDPHDFLCEASQAFDCVLDAIIQTLILYLEIIMYEACVSIIQRQDLSTLRQILLRFPLMLEISRGLDEDAFMQIVANVTYAKVTKSQGMAVDSKGLYLFFAAGRMHRRGREERTEKSIRLRSKGKIRWGKETGNTKQGQGREIADFGHFQEANIEHYYYPQAKNALVLACCLERLPESIVFRLREMRMERLRFLHSLPTLMSIDKSVLEEHLHYFTFAEMKFGAVRQPHALGEVLIIKNGSVQVGAKGLQGRTIDGSCVVGLGDMDLQVKANSQTVSCYNIKLSLLQTLLGRMSPRENSPLQLIFASAAASPVRLQPCHPEKQNKSDLSQTLRSATSFKRRMNMRSTGELGTCLQKQRRLHLRKHFSNFYNQIFEQYSEKKTRQLALSNGSEEKLVLYQIKMLERKKPRMQEINQRLKTIRLQKLRRCKVAIAESPHIKQLRNVGVTIE